LGCEAGHACPARWMWPRQAHYQLELQLRSAAPAALRVSACSPPAHTSAVIPLAPPCRNIPVGAPGPSPLFFCPNPTLTSTLTLAPPVQLYLPDEGHPSYGILRTYVKDYNDAPTSQGAISFVDSGAAGEGEAVEAWGADGAAVEGGGADGAAPQGAASACQHDWVITWCELPTQS
jgi:hypothetical protein